MTASTRRLVVAWLMLMALSAVLAVAADVRAGSHLGAPALAAIGGVLLLKSRIILGIYLGLPRRSGMLTVLVALIALTATIVIGSFVAIGG